MCKDLIGYNNYAVSIVKYDFVDNFTVMSKFKSGAGKTKSDWKTMW